MTGPIRARARLPAKAALALLLVALACSNPPEPSQQSRRGATQVSGRLLEQVDSPPYTFLRLKTGSGEAWVAIPIGRVDGKKAIAVTRAVPLRDFEIGPGRQVSVVYLGTLQQ